MSIVPQIASRQAQITKLMKSGNAGQAASAVQSMAWVKDQTAGILGYQDPAAGFLSADESEMSCLFVMSTNNEDRDGDIVVPTGCKLEAYSRNPVWFWNHQQNDNLDMPIGTAEDPNTKQICVYVEKNRVLAKCWFDQGDPDAVFIFGKVARGFIRATSIAFLPWVATKRDIRERGDIVLPAGYVYESWELTENTICGVGANSEAIRASLEKDPEAKHITRKLRKSLEACAECAKVWSPGATLESGDKAMSKKWGKSLAKKTAPVKKDMTEQLEDLNTYAIRNGGKFTSGKSVKGSIRKDNDESRAAADSSRPADEVTQALKSQEDCVSAKIPKLLEEGMDHDQAIAAAFHMCGEGKEMTPENVEETAKALGIKMVKKSGYRVYVGASEEPQTFSSEGTARHRAHDLSQRYEEACQVREDATGKVVAEYVDGQRTKSGNTPTIAKATASKIERGRWIRYQGMNGVVTGVGTQGSMIRLDVLFNDEHGNPGGQERLLFRPDDDVTVINKPSKSLKAHDEGTDYDPAKNPPEGYHDKNDEDMQDNAETKIPLGAQVLQSLYQHHSEAHDYLKEMIPQLEPDSKAKEMADEHLQHHLEKMDGIADGLKQHYQMEPKAVHEDEGYEREGNDKDIHEDGGYELEENKGETEAPDEKEPPARDEADDPSDRETQELLDEYRRGPDGKRLAAFNGIAAKHGTAKAVKLCSGCGCKGKKKATPVVVKRMSKSCKATVLDASEYLHDLSGDDAIPKRHKGGMCYHSECLAKICKDFDGDGDGEEEDSMKRQKSQDEVPPELEAKFNKFLNRLPAAWKN